MASDLVTAVYEAAASHLQAKRDLAMADSDLSHSVLFRQSVQKQLQRSRDALERAIEAWEDAERKSRLREVVGRFLPDEPNEVAR